MRARAALALLIFGLLAGCRAHATTPPVEAEGRTLDRVEPEAVGISSERLARLDAAMQGFVDDERLAGAVILLARRGKVAHVETFGHRDVASRTPMTEDTIFRIYSMTKPITGVALMMLYEEGKFRLSDPVETYLPELRNLKVALSDGPEESAVEDAHRPMTIRELMSHSAGFTYGYFSESWVDRAYLGSGVVALDQTLEEMVDKLSALPLLYQPGTRWHYSVAVDVQSYLVEVLSGMPFDRFLEERLFAPLDMRDTGFYVPAEKADRLATVYRYADDGSLVTGETYFKERYVAPPTLLSGGAGLVSTAHDYMRFCQMMLNGGELDGVRILAPLTVAMMGRDHLPQGVEMSPGKGFGLGFAVVTDPVEADGISKGELYWLGVGGTWFWIDPVEDLAFVGMVQQFGELDDIHALSRKLVYQAIMEAEGATRRH